MCKARPRDDCVKTSRNYEPTLTALPTLLKVLLALPPKVVTAGDPFSPASGHVGFPRPDGYGSPGSDDVAASVGSEQRLRMLDLRLAILWHVRDLKVPNQAAHEPDKLVAAKKPHDEIVDELYLAALSRLPSDDEKQASRDLLSEASAPADFYQDLLWALMNSKQFLFVR